MKIKSSQNGEITLLFTDIGKSCPSFKFLTSKICLLTLFQKIKFSCKFPDLQYTFTVKSLYKIFAITWIGIQPGHVVTSKYFYHGILRKNYMKMTIPWSFFYNSFVTLPLYII